MHKQIRVYMTTKTNKIIAAFRGKFYILKYLDIGHNWRNLLSTTYIPNYFHPLRVQR